MASINEKELNAINQYYGTYLSEILGFLTKSLDVEIGIDYDFSTEVPALQDLKGTHAVCELNATEGYLGYSLVVAPEAIIATISDLIMGGPGLNVYKGSLTELEINASASMIENLFEKIRSSFKESYDKDLVFSSVPKFLEKKAKGYDEAFTKINFDATASYTIKIGENEPFKVYILVNSDELITSMQNIQLLEKEVIPVKEDDSVPINLMPQTSTKMSTYDIRKLADIKIDISAELGKAQVSIKQVLSLVRGSILELDTQEGTDIAVFANGSEVARAQVVVVDGHFGIKITKILDPNERCKHI